jgi:hypothetical protein
MPQADCIAGEQHQLGLFVASAHIGEDAAPDALGRAQHAGDELLAGIAGDIRRAGAAGIAAAARHIGAAAGRGDLGAGAARVLHAAIDDLQQVDTEHPLEREIDDDQNDDGAQARRRRPPIGKLTRPPPPPEESRADRAGPRYCRWAFHYRDA